MTFTDIRRKISKLFSQKSAYGTVNYEGRLLDQDATAFGVMESYRMARTSILYTGLGEKSVAIGVSSASPNEGKSLTCSNLAVSFGMSGKKVLIVDADMRNPTQTRIFRENGKLEKKESRGLSEFLAGIIQEPQVINTGCENVDLMCAGKCPPDSAGLLGRDTFAQMMEKLRAEYDFIFFDLPPVGIIADAAVVAKHLDGYVLVAQAGFSDVNLIHDAVDTIQGIGGRIVGFILNAVEPKGGFGGRRRYAYEYNRYEKGGSNRREEEETPLPPTGGKDGAKDGTKISASSSVKGKKRQK